MEGRTPRTSRKIIFYGSASADGFIARPDGGVEWLNERPRPKDGYGIGTFYRSIDTILWGRKTVDLALAFQKAGVKGSAFDPRVEHYMFSRTMREAVPGLTLVQEPIKAFAARLRARRGRNIWMMGGAGILGAFLDEGEIDELIINVVPTMIGEGIPLVAPRRRHLKLRLVESHAFPDGVVRLHYSTR